VVVENYFFYTMKVKKIASSLLGGKESCDRKPIITPLIQPFHDTDGPQQQYLLIPSRNKINVLSMESGRTISELTLSQSTKEIYSISLACVSRQVNVGEKNSSTDVLTLTDAMDISKSDPFGDNCDDMNAIDDSQEKEWVVLAGCSDGIIAEWSLSNIHSNQSIQHGRSNEYAGIPMIHQRRTINLLHLNDKHRKGLFNSTTDITHISSPGNAMLYVLCGKRNNDCHLLRLKIPPYIDRKDPDYSDAKHEHIDKVTLKVSPLDVIATFRCNKNQITSTASNNFLVYSRPFSLLTSTGSNNKKTKVIAVAKDGFFIFLDEMYQGDDVTRNESFLKHQVLHFNQFNFISSAAISPNGEDLSLGCKDGKIEVLVSIFKRCESYINSKITDNNLKVEHPSEDMLISTLHWHSLSVKSLCYLGSPVSQAAPNLLSVGEEAVMVTWNIERGLNKPVHTLPRISKGVISHIASDKFSSSMDIVLCCMDNTIQLIQGHNHATRWKVQGLATSSNECSTIAEPSSQIKRNPLLMLDPRTQMPIMSCLHGAPGFIHWFDPGSGRVIGELEVAPFNRISRKCEIDCSYPRPVVTHVVMSSSGDDMITVDVMLSENRAIGASRNVKFKLSDEMTKMSLITNIKFWEWSGFMHKPSKKSSTVPYDLIALMPSPHSLNKEIASLAITPNGSAACSLSYEDGSFHIWGKEKSYLGSNGKKKMESSKSLSTAWKRHYKIATPAGFSNNDSEGCGNKVTFSADGSVLIVAYGQHLTLWDHTNASMLHTLKTSGDILDVHFMLSPADVVLSVGKTHITSLPPFGSGYLGEGSWSYEVPNNWRLEEKTIEISFVTPVVSRGEICVAMKQTTKEKDGQIVNSTRVVIIDAFSGDLKKRQNGDPCFWDITGSVLSMCDITQNKNGWANDFAAVLVVTDCNEMWTLDSDNKQENGEKVLGLNRDFFPSLGMKDLAALSAVDVPKLKCKKKRRLSESDAGLNLSLQSNNGFGVFQDVLDSNSSSKTPVASSELPALSGKFLRSFVDGLS